MSLKRIISANKDLREKFKKEFAKPPFTLKSALKAQPLTTNPQLVGTAFDYLLRFKIEYINKKELVQKQDWFADGVYNELLSELSKAPTSGPQRVWAERNNKKFYKAKDILESITVLYKQSKANYATYLSSGKLTDELISNTIFLAKLDEYGRSDVLNPNFDSNPDDIKDLKALISLVNEDLFTAKQKCYLNPTFGKASKLIGADADVLIDNTLIEIKVLKQLALKTEHINQLLGYYVLSLIGGINENKKDKPIENIGIYFARHAQLWTLPIADFGNKSKFNAFKKWFIDYVKKTNY